MPLHSCRGRHGRRGSYHVRLARPVNGVVLCVPCFFLVGRRAQWLINRIFNPQSHAPVIHPYERYAFPVCDSHAAADRHGRKGSFRTQVRKTDRNGAVPTSRVFFMVGHRVQR
nr:MAG TPA_asm: hypothetical protein [Caudoviricetes sp.]